MFRSLSHRDMFADLERLQREMATLFDASPSIRGSTAGAYPALNVGSTPTSVEIVAFTPGVEPSAIEVNLDRGVLTIDGERSPTTPPADAKATLHISERPVGRFRRVISLPDDIDPSAVTATCRDGVLQISIKRRESAQPRRIEVQ